MAFALIPTVTLEVPEKSAIASGDVCGVAVEG
jgi:hypothetical protein